MSSTFAIVNFILMIMLLVIIIAVTHEADIVDNDLVKHIKCSDLKNITNSSHLREQSLARDEYATRC